MKINLPDWITAISALIGVIIGLPQLINLKKTRSADFISKFKNDFFSEQARMLLFFIDLDLLSFNKDDSCFIIDNEKTSKLSNNCKKQKDFALACNYCISAWDIDDFLLGHFEDLGLFRKKRIIEMDFIYESFDWYIQKVHNNIAIQEYVKWQREQENSKDVYYYFDYIAFECKKHF